MRTAPSVRPAVATLLGLAALVLALPACAAADSPPASADPKQQPVAEVAGTAITMGEVEASVAPQLAQIDRQRRALIEQALDRLVEEKLLAAEAAARGITVEALTQAEVQAKSVEVTEEEAKAFYDANQARINRPYDQIAPQVKQYLAQQKQQELQDTLIASLRTKHQVKMLLDVDRVEVAEADSPAKGPAGAPVTVIEFSDFECPFCGRIVPALDQVAKTYGDQVRIVFRQFPLNIHPNAPKAAEASLCAHEQGKFWEMHDALFAHQKELAVEQLKTRAGELGLDQAQFDACLDSGKHKAKVDADLADGQKAGVNGTPALFVNGRFLSGAVPFETISKLIDDELGRKGITPKKTEVQ